MIRKPRLFTPGPTQPLPQAQAAEAAARLHHHSRQYSALLKEVRAGLKYFFNTRNDVVVLTSSGTGAMEAAVVNTVEPGDDVLVLNAGRFGARWSAICHAFGARVKELTVPPGRAPDPGDVKKALGKKYRAMFMQGVETSTGTLMPVREIAAIAKRSGCLVVVDAITMLGAHEVRPDDWGLDITLGASQKALAMAPGLAFACISPDALARMRAIKTPRFYFDLVREHDAQAALKTTFTPALSLMAGCDASLKWLRETSLEALIGNAALLSGMTRAAMNAAGLKLFSKSPAHSVTAVEAPPQIDVRKFSEKIENRFGALIGKGQDSLSDRIFRVSHLGYCDYIETIGLIGAIENALGDLGAKVSTGKALAAAQQFFRGHIGDAP
ncbi:MAG: alanine--glyoxylate aminotransferase family protein [Planctomycetes bacterium]|nr:alanine--glyoxylate aminotransferase family protein [Planctomycetota bacterium]